MTKRQKLIQNVRMLYNSAHLFNRDSENDLGVRHLTVWLSSGRYDFNNANEVKALAKKMMRSFKGNKTKA